MRYAKGHKFEGPDGMGFELTRDVFAGESVRATDFKPYGGAPTPEPNGEIPVWLARQLWPGHFTKNLES